jgi:predicted glycoside hydrolase/deacetylase ChbG (UPF0249 family)
MSERRTLVVNADDFGRSPGITRGVLRAHVHGIVTSTSLMVRYEHSAAAAAAAASHPGLGVGLHLDLAEWAFRDGGWRCVYEVVPAGDAWAVEREVRAQLARFRELVDRDPTHLDSHQHVHRDEPVRSVVGRVAGELGVPVRHGSSVRYCGAFYGQGRLGTALSEAITPTALAALIRDLPPGATELACHPADDVDIDTDYGRERLVELASLCDPAVHAAVRAADAHLAHFGDAPARTAGSARCGATGSR